MNFPSNKVLILSGIGLIIVLIIGLSFVSFDPEATFYPFAGENVLGEFYETKDIKGESCPFENAIGEGDGKALINEAANSPHSVVSGQINKIDDDFIYILQTVEGNTRLLGINIDDNTNYIYFERKLTVGDCATLVIQNINFNENLIVTDYKLISVLDQTIVSRFLNSAKLNSENSELPYVELFIKKAVLTPILLTGTSTLYYDYSESKDKYIDFCKSASGSDYYLNSGYVACKKFIETEIIPDLEKNKEKNYGFDYFIEDTSCYYSCDSAFDSCFNDCEFPEINLGYKICSDKCLDRDYACKDACGKIYEEEISNSSCFSQCLDTVDLCYSAC